MSNTPIHQQRLRALLIAAQKRQQFDTLQEMRNIKMMVVLSFLLEFECATAQTLLELLEIKSNAILTRLVKQRFIKIFRWQNSQVYAPTTVGKQWLLERLDDAEEIERVRNSKIRRKIGGYSAEHDLLVQRAAIRYARENVRPGEQWRIFKPQKTEKSGAIQDARIVYTLGDRSNSTWIEVERTSKPPVETICKFMSTAQRMANNDTAAILCASRKIFIDYAAVMVALRELSMMPVSCVQLDGAVARHGLQAGEWFAWRELERIDIAMIDAEGVILDQGDFLEVAFTSTFWLLAMQQPKQDWQHWARRLAHWLIDEGSKPTHWKDENNTFEHDPVEPDDDEIQAAKDKQAQLMIAWLGGPDGTDNPMRSASDLRRAEARYRAWLASVRLPSPVPAELTW